MATPARPGTLAIAWRCAPFEQLTPREIHDLYQARVGVFVLEQICGVPRDAAVAYSFVTWVIQLGVNLGSGAVAAAFQDLSVRELVQAPSDEPVRSAGGR